MKAILSVLCFITFFSSANAQTDQYLKDQLIKDWERAKAFTLEYLEVMPADQFSFRAQDSIRTFAQQMLHLSMGTASLVSNGSGKQRPEWMSRNLEMFPSACSYDSVTYFVTTSYDFAIEAIKNLDVTTLQEKIKRGPFDETRLAWLLKAFEHQTHHRGQATIYIRLLGIKPPNEKLF